ncbi:MAG: hypothetical protein V1873_08620 [Verrucomicrobiota bacterium]
MVTARGWLLAGAAALLAAGCRSVPRPPAAAPAATVMVEVEIPAGRVMHVNERDGYVILRCESLPSPGEEARVYRGEQRVGRLSITGPGHSLFMAADIIEGAPQIGDTVKMVRKRSAPAPSAGEKL